MTALPNPERAWTSQREPLRIRELIESRLGSAGTEAQLLDGGHANWNIKVTPDRVLRIYRRDPEALQKEQNLLSRPWRSFRVPEIAESGSDFLLLEWIELRPLQDRAEHGRKVGAAAAEIHGIRFDRPGLLDADLEVVAPLPDPEAYVVSRLEALGGSWGALEAPILSALAQLPDLGSMSPVPATLNHGDFKASNLFLGPEDELVVLDWEFAFAGPRLMDLGQLLRWGASEAFRAAFEQAYRSHGGSLPDRWERSASVLDLLNLVGLLRPAEGASPRSADIRDRIEATVGRGQSAGRV